MYFIYDVSTSSQGIRSQFKYGKTEDRRNSVLGYFLLIFRSNKQKTLNEIFFLNPVGNYFQEAF